MFFKFLTEEFQKIIQLLNPIIHVHRLVRLCLEFGKVKIQANNDVSSV